MSKTRAWRFSAESRNRKLSHSGCGRKAAVNRAHSRRFAQAEAARNSRQRLDCGDFSTAFHSHHFNPDDCDLLLDVQAVGRE
jgi:hypothetical protein